MADAAPKTQIKSPSDHENPSKFFLYKAALVTVFLVLVPLFPSLAPDFFNQTLHARSWELLQLIFVGIAVSYGLFSKKNDEPHKDYKIDNAQSYVSKLLQVSSVFDDESENHTVIEESKFQALNSQYYRGEPPLVVVAKENSAVDKENGVVSQISQKPLLLPVRSLKQRVPSPNSGKSRIGDFGRLNVDKVAAEKEEAAEEKVVLRSPIPWRSRSGRMEMKENGDELASPSTEEQELNRSESRSFRSFRATNPNASSPKKLSYESQSKSGEDVVRKKSFAPPPPAPPPPPSPPFLRKSVLIKSNSSIPVGSTKKELARSARSVPSEEAQVDELMRLGADSVKSVRSFKLNEFVEKPSMDYEIKYPDKRKQKKEEVVMETRDEEEEESDDDDEFDEHNFAGSSSSNVEAPADDNGRDVDKKADEFIAKFREQIRLQRIESIRKSTAQRAGKNSR
ncbi:uncharacterized protein LOC131015266 [Salvia miltiorrhiza]|uniref:uncharacterized protein LOC131015266 n=1 Tax=Salvia miltiorrhiza TaxID=226208 RepID=UPI0025AC5785|nr:uncharacterized protein LOC131015266 [Salvia miltiorrhiza]